MRLIVLNTILSKVFQYTSFIHSLIFTLIYIIINQKMPNNIISSFFFILFLKFLIYLNVTEGNISYYI